MEHSMLSLWTLLNILGNQGEIWQYHVPSSPPGSLPSNSGSMKYTRKRFCSLQAQLRWLRTPALNVVTSCSKDPTKCLHADGYRTLHQSHGRDELFTNNSLYSILPFFLNITTVVHLFRMWESNYFAYHTCPFPCLKKKQHVMSVFSIITTPSCSDSSHRITNNVWDKFNSQLPGNTAGHGSRPGSP